MESRIPAASVRRGAEAMRPVSAMHTSTSLLRLTAGARWPFSLYIMQTMEVATQVAMEVGTVMMGRPAKWAAHFISSMHLPPPTPTRTVQPSDRASAA